MTPTVGLENLANRPSWHPESCHPHGVLLAYALMDAPRGKMQHANSGIFMEFIRNRRNGADNRRAICRRQWSHELALALSRDESLELATALASEGVPNHTRMDRTQTKESGVHSHSE